MSRKMIISAVVALVVVAAAAATFFLVIHKPITHADVVVAQQAMSDLDQDLLEASIDYNGMAIGSDSTTATVNSTADTINSKLDDAQKQFNILNSSVVLQDTNVNKKFQALKVKFNPYVTYIRQNTADSKALMPIVGDFETKIQALNQTNPSTVSEVSAYLQSLKTIISSTTQRLDGTTVQSSVNEQAVDAVKTYLHSLSNVASQTQADISAGKDAFTLQDDLFKAYDADTAYTKALDNVNQQEETKQQKLDTTNEVAGLRGAIGGLEFTVKD